MRGACINGRLTTSKSQSRRTAVINSVHSSSPHLHFPCTQFVEETLRREEQIDVYLRIFHTLNASKPDKIMLRDTPS